MKKPFMQRTGDFLAGQGFYIVLFLCVAAIGVSGYYLISGLNLTGEPTAISASATAGVEEEPVVIKPEQPVVTTAPKETETTEPVSDAVAPTELNVAEETVLPVVFTWPVKGTVLTTFNLEALAYDVTMGDWRTHDGVDIAAAQSASVLAVADGSVTHVYEDALLGTTVIISHGGGLCSQYSNLAAKPTVAEGDTVTCGAVIGSVGTTAIAENELESHLHFAMSLDEISVDPLEYLPQ